MPPVIFVLGHSPSQAAASVAQQRTESLRQQLADTTIQSDGQDIRVTLSAGYLHVMY